MINLKPCPFCGGRNLATQQVRMPLPDFELMDAGNVIIACLACRCCFIFELSKVDAKTQWNRRTYYPEEIEKEFMKICESQMEQEN